MTPFRERNPIPIGLVSLGVIVALVLAAMNIDRLPVVGAGKLYTAHFTEAAGLTAGDEVRVAGVSTGKVAGVELDGDRVKVSFRIKDAWVGNDSTVYIKIRSVLGQKYLALDPRGDTEQDADETIPLGRTASPYDVIEAFQGLAETTNEIDTTQLATSFTVLADSVRDSPDEVRSALDGLSRLSETISKRDGELATLLANARDVSGILADRTGEVERLIADGNLLLAELQERRNAISRLLDGTKALSAQLSGLVADNSEQLAPVLGQLELVTDLLLRNQQQLSEGLYLMGPFARVFTNTIGNGRWFDSYLYGVLPPYIGSVDLLGGA